MMSFPLARRAWRLLACALALAPACSAAGSLPPAAPALALTLLQEVQLDHARILLGDVAALPAGAAPELARLDLGAAPRVNAIGRLSRAQIALLIRRRLPQPPAALAWSGADSVSVQRRSQALAGAVLGQAAVDAVLAAYGPRFAGLQAAVESLPADVEIIPGPYAIRARALDAARLPARASVWLDLLVEGQVQRSVVVAVGFTLQRPAYLARRALSAGSMAAARDFEVREINVAGLDAQPVSAAGQPGWRVRGALQAGQVLTRAQVPASGTVFPGDTVLLQARSGAIGIDVAAVVQAEAVPGQRVSVRASHSSDVLTGRLTAAGTVVIE
jgi:flagella basal body P-ring formation protein FlgA